jgi:hypothetical protein
MKTMKMALAAVLLGGLTFGALALPAAASPYHQDILPNGVVTGPLSPDANGG